MIHAVSLHEHKMWSMGAVVWQDYRVNLHVAGHVVLSCICGSDEPTWQGQFGRGNWAGHKCGLKSL